MDYDVEGKAKHSLAEHLRERGNKNIDGSMKQLRGMFEELYNTMYMSGYVDGFEAALDLLAKKH